MHHEQRWKETSWEVNSQNDNKEKHHRFPYELNRGFDGICSTNECDADGEGTNIMKIKERQMQTRKWTTLLSQSRDVRRTMAAAAAAEALKLNGWDYHGERERMDIGAHMAPGGWAKPFGMVEVIVLVHVEYIIL